MGRINEIIKEYGGNFNGIDDDTDIILSSDKYRWTFYLEKGDSDAEDILKELFTFKYIPRSGCYKKDYVELLINSADLFFYLDFSGYEVPELGVHSDKIYYNIGPVSQELWALITTNESYDGDFIEGIQSISSIKIFNINKVKDIEIDDKSFIKQIRKIAEKLFFDLSYKYSIVLKLEELPKVFEEYDAAHNMCESLDKVKDNFIKKNYDSDLISYYNRAMKMEYNEFKYIAFFQVLECIFDEVYSHETVEDVKQIINANWFSSYDNKHIKDVINIVEQYSSNKTDREKLRLVLERYFKGDSHEAAFYLANQDISDILITKLKLIKKKEELKDYQKIAKIIYDFRCDCTHANREFPVRKTFEGDDVELDNYIGLIRKISERIIVNYNRLD